MYLGSVDDAVEQRGQCPVAGAHVGLHAELLELHPYLGGADSQPVAEA